MSSLTMRKMKKSDIQVGTTYSNGKGGRRLVTARDRSLAPSNAMDSDWLTYDIIAGRNAPLRGQRMTALGFVRWANNVVVTDDCGEHSE